MTKSRMALRAETFAIVATFGLLGSAVLAQAPTSTSPQVRISGLAVYEVPGVLTIVGDRVSGTGVIDTKDGIVHVQLPQSPETMTVPTAQRRLVGQALRVESGVLLLSQNGPTPLRIPLDAVGKLEIRDHRSRTLAIVTGIGAWYGTGALFAATQRLDSVMFVIGPLAVAPVVGITIGYLVGREHWREVPVASLSTLIGAGADADVRDSL